MPVQVISNGLVAINGVDLSAYVQDVKLKYDAETVDRTTYANTNRTVMGGLTKWSVDISFLNNYDASAVNATIRPLLGTTACFEIRPKNSCTTSINPSISGIGVISSYPPFTGKVGAALMADVKIDNASLLGYASSS